MPKSSEAVPGTTVEATIAVGEVQALGTAGPYRTLRQAPGEGHLARADLLGVDAGTLVAGLAEAEVRPLLRFVHITDFQLADLASPGRLDFLQQFTGLPEWAGMLPAYRPQELLSLHAFEAMIRTLRELAAPVGPRIGEPISFVITTGDNTDSAALNELRTFLSIMDGGAEVDPMFGTSDPLTIPSHTVSGRYWNPEPESRDSYKRQHGFPDHPGVLAAAGEPIRTAGLGLSWLACFGNHDCLAQGRAVATDRFQDLVTGTHRPLAPPTQLPAGATMDRYLTDPTVLSSGTGRLIDARDDRRVVTKAEYIRAHLDSTTGPVGHGFTEQNLTDDTAYYCHDDIAGIRIIVLDTTNPAGGVTGSIGARQHAWLTERLIESHSRYLAADGTVVETATEDRLVIVASHHGLSMMDNELPFPDGQEPADADRPRQLAADIEALLHRFGNVALWLTGHIHQNKVTAHPGVTGGFWEVCSSAMAEWPTQARLIELWLPEGASALLAIRCTMIDHQAPARPGPELDLWNLAALHRELSANEPTRVGGDESAGRPQDRNVDLLVPLSRSLSRALVTRWAVQESSAGPDQGVKSRN